MSTTPIDIVLNRELVNILQNNYNAKHDFLAVYSLQSPIDRHRTDEPKIKIFYDLAQYMSSNKLQDLNNTQLTILQNMFYNDQNKNFLL